MSTLAVCKPSDGSNGLTRLPDLDKPPVESRHPIQASCSASWNRHGLQLHSGR